MPSSSFHDFELELGPAAGAGYALAVRSPAGEARQTLMLPAAQGAVQDPASGLAGSAAQETGARLFHSVFSGETLSLYDASRALATRDGAGVRLRLRILAPELAVLPWEMLYDPRQGEFVALSQQTPIVRAVETREPLRSMPVAPPLRILGLAASPAGLPSLDAAREEDLLRHAVEPSGAQIELAWTSTGTWRDLQEHLQRGPWHIFHFIGHGVFDESMGEGVLLLVDEQGRPDPRSTREIARLVADQATLRLVVLNACESAQGGKQVLYSSIAEQLVRRGLPAVLAMQNEISDTAAVEFTRSFYAALGNGLPVDAACAEARKAMSLASSVSSEWATPVLFLGSADGELWTWQRQAAGGAMDADKTQPWWEQVSNSVGKVDARHAAGDVIIAVVGAGSRNVAAGKNIRQTVAEVLGPPAADDAQQIEQGFAGLLDALGKLPVDEATVERAKVRLEILHQELVRPEDDTPNAGTIITMGDWLLKNVPAIGKALGALFALPAAGRVMARAGESAVKWAQDNLRSAYQ